MIIDKDIMELNEARRSILESAASYSSILLENDEGLVAIDSSGDGDGGLWYIEEPLDDQQAADQQTQDEQAAAEQQAVTDDSGAQQVPEEAEQAAAEQQAQDEQTAAEQQPQLDEDDIIAIQISQTQEVFTKMYLIKRLEKLKKYVENLIDLMEMKYDIDEFDQLKRISLYLDILDDIGLILPADTLYHMITGFEFDLLDLVQKISKVVEVPQYDIPEEESHEGLRG